MDSHVDLASEDFSAAEVLLSLSPLGLAMLRQLSRGIRWDGHIDSKTGRDELVAKGLAWHTHGYQGLTANGLVVAVEDGEVPRG